MPVYVNPFGFVWLRIVVTTVLFWITALFIKTEGVQKKDVPYISILSAVGIVIPVLCFYKGLSLTTPINGAVIMVTTPIIVFVFSLFILKEKLSAKRVLGVFIGLFGAYFLTTAGKQISVNAENIPLGNLLVFINACGYALYLIFAKKMVVKYHPITFVKWLYTFASILMTPIVYKDVLAVNWLELPISVVLIIAYVIVFATYCNFLFNLFGLKHLKPTTVSAFIYSQPVIATVFALFLGTDTLSVIKIISSVAIFVGVYLVSLKPVHHKEKLSESQ